MYLEQLILKLHTINDEIHVAVKSITFRDKTCRLNEDKQIATASEIEKEVHHLVERCFETLKDISLEPGKCLTELGKILDLIIDCLDHYRPFELEDDDVDDNTFLQIEKEYQIHIKLLVFSTKWFSDELITGVYNELMKDKDRKITRELLNKFPSELKETKGSQTKIASPLTSKSSSVLFKSTGQEVLHEKKQTATPSKRTASITHSAG